MGILSHYFFRISDGSPPATRRRGGYSETLAGGQMGPARAAPSAAYAMPPTAAARAGAVAAAGSRRVLSLWRHHMQSDAKGKGQVRLQRACKMPAPCPA